MDLSEHRAILWTYRVAVVGIAFALLGALCAGCYHEVKRDAEIAVKAEGEKKTEATETRTGEVHERVHEDPVKRTVWTKWFRRDGSLAKEREDVTDKGAVDTSRDQLDKLAATLTGNDRFDLDAEGTTHEATMTKVNSPWGWAALAYAVGGAGGLGAIWKWGWPFAKRLLGIPGGA